MSREAGGPYSKFTRILNAKEIHPVKVKFESFLFDPLKLSESSGAHGSLVVTFPDRIYLRLEMHLKWRSASEALLEAWTSGHEWRLLVKNRRIEELPLDCSEDTIKRCEDVGNGLR